jgi:two-component system chemotaxis response regulator CheY
MEKIRVLVVDDSPFIHKAIARALNSDAYEICGIGSNGREGAELFSKLNPDVVTMDITMPVMDGLGSARIILGQNADAKIVMLSAMGDDALMNEAKSIGIRVFLQKPFKPDELKAAIAQLVAGGTVI